MHRLSIHKYCKPRRRVSSSASWNVLGSICHGIWDWKELILAVVVSIGLTPPQQCLRQAKCAMTGWSTLVTCKRSQPCPSILSIRVGSAIAVGLLQGRLWFWQQWFSHSEIRHTAGSNPDMPNSSGSDPRPGHGDDDPGNISRRSGTEERRPTFTGKETHGVSPGRDIWLSTFLPRRKRVRALAYQVIVVRLPKLDKLNLVISIVIKDILSYTIEVKERTLISSD
jgi:hypothetical protein